jgi:hypothetical protein
MERFSWVVANYAGALLWLAQETRPLPSKHRREWESIHTLHNVVLTAIPAIALPYWIAHTVVGYSDVWLFSPVGTGFNFIIENRESLSDGRLVSTSELRDC